MKNRTQLIKLLVAFSCMIFASQSPADDLGADVVNTSFAKASVRIVLPISPANCTVEMKVTALTDQPLVIMKLPNDVRMKISLVDSDGNLCPLTDEGEKYYGEKDMDPNWITSYLVWLKKDDPVFIKINLAKYFQLKAGHWVLKMSIPLMQIREEGAARQGGGWVEFKDIKIEIPEPKK